MLYDKNRLERKFRFLGVRIIRCRFVILLLTFVVIGLAAWQLPRLSIATSIESFFVEHNQALSDYQEFRDLFGRDEEIVILVETRDVFDREFLATLQQFHADLENSLPLLHEVNSLVNARYVEADGDRLFVRDFLEELPRSDTEARRLRRQALAYPYYEKTFLPRRVVDEDQRGRSEAVGQTVVVVKTAARSALTDDGKRLRPYARGVEEPSGQFEAGQPSITQVETIAIIGILDTIVKEYDAPDFRITYSGTPVYQSRVEPMIRTNMKKMCVMIVIVTMFFMGFLFARGSGVILPQLTVVFGLLVALGLMALLSVRLTLTSSMLPSILLSIGLTAPIHFLVIYYKYQRRIGRWRGIIATLEHAGLPIAMTSVTTIAGLLSFAVSEIAPIAHLGLFTAVGILAILLLTLFSLPALLSILQVVPGSDEADVNYEASLFNRILMAIGRFGVDHARGVVIFFVLLTVGSLIGAGQVRFSHNMLHYFSEDSDFLHETRLVEEQAHGFRALEILIDSGRENGVADRSFLGKIDTLEAFAASKIDELEAGEDEDDRYQYEKHFIGRTLSTAGFVREMQLAAHGHDSDFARLPQDDSSIESLFSRLEKKSSDNIADVTDTDKRLGRLTAMLYWKDAAEDIGFVETVRQRADDLFGAEGVILTGVVAIGSGIIDAMMRSLTVGYLTAFVLIGVLMVLAVGELRLGLYAMIPNLLPILVGLGAMGYLGVPLNTYNLIGGSIVVGLAVDDTIHFFHNFRNAYGKSGDVHHAVRETLGSAGRALLTTTLVLVSCFWLRLFSDLEVVADFGLIMGLALMTAFLADVLLAPALLQFVLRPGKPDTGRKLP